MLTENGSPIVAPLVRCLLGCRRRGSGGIEGIRIIHREDNLYEPTVLGHPPALDYMELVGVGSTVKNEERVGVPSNRVDDERVAPTDSP